MASSHHNGGAEPRAGSPQGDPDPRGNISFPSFDALLPSEMALKAEEIGVKKANLDLWSKGGLAVLAGAFIAMGAIFATVAWTGAADKIPWGVSRLIGGLAFSLGLILVVVGGAELFTGNNLIVMAWASRRISTYQLTRNWVVVYVGNFIGSVGIVVIVFLSRHFMADDGGLGLTALNIALTKVHLGFAEALASGIMCNVLVCMAIWLAYSSRTTGGKILAIVFPISAFVAAGFEHCIANMYFVPMGILLRQSAPGVFWQKIGKSATDFADVTWPNFLAHNLLPVTIGNIIGGAILVGAMYWVIYLRKRSR